MARIEKIEENLRSKLASARESLTGHDEWYANSDEPEYVETAKQLTEREIEVLENALHEFDNHFDDNIAVSKKIYGLDGYSRFVEVDDERYQIEAWPFSRWNFYERITFRIDIIRWHLGIMRQCGFSCWWEIQQY
jgi:hypothetical protein